MTELNKKVKELMDMPPLIPYTEEIKANVEQSAMNMALGMMYASKEFRSYMQLNINRAIRSILECRDINDVYFAKGCVHTLKQLLNNSREAFEKMEALKAKLKKI